MSTSAILATTFFMSHGAMNGPFLTLTARPVLPELLKVNGEKPMIDAIVATVKQFPSNGPMCEDAYDALIPLGGTYRAFRDRVFGAGAKHEPDVSSYVPAPSTAYHRFLAFHWGAIEAGGPAVAGEWTRAEADRLASLVALAHRQGFRVPASGCANCHRYHQPGEPTPQPGKGPAGTFTIDQWKAWPAPGPGQ